MRFPTPHTSCFPHILLIINFHILQAGLESRPVPSFGANHSVLLRLEASEAKYQDGQRLQFELNMHEHTLTFKIDGRLVCIASNVDHRRVRPYICMQGRCSVKLMERKSYYVGSISSIISFKDRISGLDNGQWTLVADTQLLGLNSGTTNL